MLHHMNRIVGASGSSGFNAQYISGYSSVTSGSTQTFNSCNFGSAAADRRIYVVIMGRSASFTQVSSVTIGGVSATLVGGNTSNSLGPTKYAAASVPTGATGTVSVTFGASATSCTIAIYRITGQTTAIASANVDAQLDVQISAVTSLSIAANTDSTGFALVCMNIPNARSLNSTTNWTEDFPNSSSLYHAGLGTSTGGSITYSASWTSSTTGGIFVATFKQ
jgi:hypothetical protein